jgi:hypothetical protein
MLIAGSHDKFEHSAYAAQLLAEFNKHSKPPAVYITIINESGEIPQMNIQIHTILMCIDMHDPLDFDIMIQWYTNLHNRPDYTQYYAFTRKFVIIRNYFGGYSEIYLWKTFATVKDIILENDISRVYKRINQ